MQSVRRRITEILKEHGSATVAELAASLGMAQVSVRHHLDVLVGEDLVELTGVRRHDGAGRPSQVYSLTPQAARLFPQRSDELAARLLTQLRGTLPAREFGELLTRLGHDAAGEAPASANGQGIEARLDEVACGPRLAVFITRVQPFTPVQLDDLHDYLCSIPRPPNRYRALGADLTLLWEPTEAMRYRNWLWRTEAYYLRKNILAPDGSGKDALNTWGAYSYFQRKVSRTTEIGARLDYFRPDVKGYADVSGLSLSPLAVTTPDARQWQISPYLTWWQSPWVKWRLEYNHRWGRGLPDDDKLFLQCTFAAGPHKHERY